jgi:phosphatidylserine/phosphatidylglycerophosphate/cardiolipin synthase-like enzyme
MIVDRKELYVLGFNFTYLDMEHSRSFGLITDDAKLVKEAVKLFEADTKRQSYEAGSSQFIVSPANAREELSEFISCAKKEIAIYDPEIADPRMIKLLEDRVKAGVGVRVIGKIDGSDKLQVRSLAQMRLHVRSIVRDGKDVFLGSQSLRPAELETRREVGLLTQNAKIAGRILKTFEEDWAIAGEHLNEQPIPTAKAARKVAKAVSKSLPPMEEVLQTLVTEASNGGKPIEIDSAKLQEAVKVAVKQAVEQSVLAAVEEAAEMAKE